MVLQRNSIILTAAEMLLLDDGQEWYAPSDHVVLGFPYERLEEINSTLGLCLWVNGECHDNWVSWSELPKAVQQRFCD